MVSGILADNISRGSTKALGAAIFCVGSIIECVSSDLACMLVGRGVAGIEEGFFLLIIAMGCIACFLASIYASGFQSGAGQWVIGVCLYLFLVTYGSTWAFTMIWVTGAISILELMLTREYATEIQPLYNRAAVSSILNRKFMQSGCKYPHSLYIARGFLDGTTACQNLKDALSLVLNKSSPRKTPSFNLGITCRSISDDSQACFQFCAVNAMILKREIAPS
ncbi:hypothetical protein J3R30DRAFT_3526299 [Lentinula aciculospora]|uniref:Uncharacterized protein n=1 Tax=Lentinula aciculospora TaxID=153920 RepID=A0A9W9DIW4_9AGAR|nr:hypothetical protein J3R30DRAFT_3526299 [Lentinula aciculospora]